MKERPWIWVILANLVLIAGVIALVVIAAHHPPQDVPLTHGH